MEKVFRAQVALNAFERFGLVPHFNVDEDCLHHRYKCALLALHPDLYLSAPRWLQEQVNREASEWNAAYRALKEPLERARLMFLYHEIELEKFPLSSVQLFEIFEHHRTIEHACASEKVAHQRALRQSFDATLANLACELEHERWPQAAACYHLLRALHQLIKRLGH